MGVLIKWAWLILNKSYIIISTPCNCYAHITRCNNNINSSGSGGKGNKGSSRGGSWGSSCVSRGSGGRVSMGGSRDSSCVSMGSGGFDIGIVRHLFYY